MLYMYCVFSFRVRDPFSSKVTGQVSQITCITYYYECYMYCVLEGHHLWISVFL